MSYAPHDSLVAKVKKTATPARFALGVALLVPGSLILSTFILGFLVGALGIAGGGHAGLNAVLAGRDPQSVLILLISFAGHIAALALVLRLVHKRYLPALIGPVGQALPQAARVIAFLALFFAVYAVVPAGENFTLTRHHEVGEWIVWVAPAMAFILIQVSAEELVFRGYLQSHLAAMVRTPVIWMGVPAVLFGLLHYDTSIYGDNAWLIALWATGFGLAAADVTARAGTLGPAIAMHLANNTLAFLVASPQGYLDGLALYTYSFAMDDPSQVLTWFPQEVLATFCIWLCTRLALRR